MGLADQAALAFQKDPQSVVAVQLYRQAAEGEARALDALDPSKQPITLGIIVMSIVLFRFLAQDYDQIPQIVNRWLDSDQLPSFATDQLQKVLTEPKKIHSEQLDVKDQSWVEYLKPISSPSSILNQYFEELLRSSDEEIRSYIKNAQHPDPAVRSELAGKLGQSGKEFALPILGTLLYDTGTYVRLIASEAIGDLAA